MPQTDILAVLDAWDAGEWVTVPRLTVDSPATEQAAHLLAFELLREFYGQALPNAAAAFQSWGLKTTAEVLAWPDMTLCLLPDHITAVKSWVYHALSVGWTAALPQHVEQTERISRRWPRSPVLPAPLPEVPVAPSGLTTLELHQQALERRLDALEAAPRGTKAALTKAQAAQLRRLEQLTEKWTKAEADALAQTRDTVADVVEEALSPVETQLAFLAGRIEALEGRSPPVAAVPATVRGARPVVPGPVPPRPEVEAPVVVGAGAGKGPPVVEGARPLEHGLRGDQPRPRAPVRMGE